MDSKPASSNHGFVFSSLVVLVFCSVGISLLHLPHGTNNLLIFVIAFIMAALVAFQYMGLRMEGPFVVGLVVVPLILFVVLVFFLMPDIVHVPVNFIRKL